MKKEIHDFIKNVLCYNGTYTITQDNKIIFDNIINVDGCVVSKFNFNFFPYEIQYAPQYNLYHLNISSLKNFPNECESAIISFCENLKNEIELKQKISTITISSNTNIKSVIVTTDNLHIFNSTLNPKALELEKITLFNDKQNTIITINDCHKIIDFNQINLPPTIKHLTVINCNIKTLKNFNTVVKDDLAICLPFLENYKFLNEIKAGTIYVDLNQNIKNVILALLQHSCVIFDANFKSSILSNCITYNKLCRILNSYTIKENKSEFIMDCALELIDCGYEEAAEL